MRTLLLPLVLLLSACVTVDNNAEPELNANPREKADARLALGMGYLQQGDMVKARENLEKALQHDKSYYRAQLAMAHYFEQVGEETDAEKLYKTALRQHPRNGNVMNNYGTFLCKQERYPQADQLFNRAIEQPYYYLIPASYENAALCALKAGKPEQAMGYFKRTLDHDPRRVTSLLRLTKLEIEQGEYTSARIRLMNFHQQFGVQQASLALLVELEERAGNSALEEKYRKQLEALSNG